jgi:transcription termination factor Rho
VDAIGMRKVDLLFEIFRNHQRRGGTILSRGVVEVLKDGCGFLRSPNYSYLPPPRMSSSRSRWSAASASGPATSSTSGKEGPLLLPGLRLHHQRSREFAKRRIPFESLTPLFPNDRLTLERGPEEISMRVMDLLTPIGKGQRGLIVAPPRTGKTVLMQRWPTASPRTTRR